MRLVIVLLLLVVLPTALLSLLAGRSIQSREVLLQRRLSDTAVDHLASVSKALNVKVLADLHSAEKLFQSTVLSGDSPDVMRRLVPRLKERSLLAADFYLFMNPWNFIYPESGRSPNRSGVKGEDDDGLGGLRQELIHRIAVSPPGKDGYIAFRYEQKRYCFISMSGVFGVYAGIRVDDRRAKDEIASLLGGVSGGH